MMAPQYILPLAHELVVDLFAGGGGASCGIEQAIGRHVDVAVNHDRDAVALHQMNHPQTEHYVADVFEVAPRQATGGRPVGLLHASPDCTHHSQARAGQPRSRAVRSLSWVVHRWAGQVRPRVITLENVEQILQWSPLVAKRCPRTGRVVRLDGTVAAPGVRVPVQEQFLVPDVRRKGRNWRHFVAGLRAMGYAVQWRTLCAADFGAPTTRSRLFMVARCDGEPITWPQPTHHKRPAKGQKAWRAAAECIDWHLDCPSIFERPRPLAEATLRRVAKGIRRYVLDSADPFIVRIGQMGSAGDHVRGASQLVSTVTTKAEHALVAPTLVQAGYGERPGQAPRVLDLAQPLGTVVAGGRKHALAGATLLPLTHQGASRVNAPGEPLPTITAAHRGEMAMASAVLVGVGGRAGQTEPRPVEEPGLTTTGKADCAVSVAYLAQMNGGGYTGSGHDAREPASTITAAGSQQQLVAALLTHAYSSNTCGGEGDMRRPAKTVTTGGHHALLECTLSREHEEGALRVAAFLTRYYGEGGQHGDARDPLATITTRDRLALVTVTLQGTPYVIVDIGLRMLQPQELYRCQGFPAAYIIDRRADGSTLTKSAQTRMCGNSVSPPPMAALERARRTAIRAHMGFGSGGATQSNTGLRTDLKRRFTTAQQDWASYPPAIAAAGARLSGVLIENRPAAEVLQQHDTPTTLHFVDPPYVHCTRVIRSSGGYRHELTDSDHEALLALLLGLQGMVVLCGYQSDLYHRALASWERHTTPARISGGRGTTLREEVVWLNPACTAALRRCRGGLFAEVAA